MLFYETCFEESNINRKTNIWSQYKIITKFRPKKMGEFGFAQSVRKLPENEGKVLFDKTHFGDSNIIRKQLIFSQDMITTKF